MPKTVYNSSTPIKPNFDPVCKNSSASANCTMNYEKIYPGIYLTSAKDLCAPDDLKIYGFTHIIYIDKHHIIARNNGQAHHIGSSHGKCDAQHPQLQPQRNRHKHDDDDDDDRRNENVIKGTSVTASITIRQTATSTSMMASTSRCGSNNSSNGGNNRSLCITTTAKVQDAGTSAACSTAAMSFAHEMPIDEEPSTVPPPPSSSSSTTATAQASSTSSLLHSKHYPSNENLFGHSDFATLDLNFGDSTYFTANVLPNCYKAVSFIEDALKNNGAVLVIDCIGEHQKCVTIVIGFLMYKYNKNFL